MGLVPRAGRWKLAAGAALGAVARAGGLAAPGVTQAQVTPRAPLIIVSPYARPGYTDTTGTTFAGILGYTERTFGLSSLGANDAAAYPFSNAFNYAQAPQNPARMVHRPLPASAKRIHLTPALENDPT
jgi:phospholipase C